MRIERSLLLPCTPEHCLAEVRTTRLLRHVAWPMVVFTPETPPSFPDEWEEKAYLVSMRLFGVLPLGRQHIDISIRDRSAETGRFHVELRDNGHGTLISTWDHRITIEAAPTGCRYTDRVDIRAGLLTPFATLFAWVFYRHRQRRWRQVAERGFTHD